MPGHRKSTPFWTGGAGPRVRVVIALTMVDLEGPREMAPPQLSRLVICVGCSRGPEAIAVMAAGMAARTRRKRIIIGLFERVNEVVEGRL